MAKTAVDDDDNADNDNVEVRDRVCCTYLTVECGLPCEHNDDNGDVDDCPQDEDGHSAHHLDHVPETGHGIGRPQQW